MSKNLRKDLASSEGIKIHYEVCDLNSGKYVLVFLHGLGGNLTAWDEERKFFHSKKISTLALDFRGHGLSGNPKNGKSFKTADLAKDVFEVLKKEKFESYILIGHCLGGMVVIEMEVSIPDFSKAAVLIDTSYKAPLFKKSFKKDDAITKILKTLALNSPTYKIHGDADLNEFTGSWDFDPKRIASDIAHTSLKTYFLLLEETLEYDNSKSIKNIKKPVLIIQGMKDIVIPPKTAELFKERIKTSWVDFVENANHILVLNNPRELNEDIYKFLNLIKLY